MARNASFIRPVAGRAGGRPHPPGFRLPTRGDDDPSCACRGCAGFEAPGRKIGLGAQRPKLLEPEPKHAILSTPFGQIIHARNGVGAPYSWDIGKVSLSKVANVEKKMPKNFISKDGFGITQSCKNYLRPFIQGDPLAPFAEAVIQTASLKNRLVKTKLKRFKV